MQVIYHPEAEAELTQAARYYDSQQPTLGSDFLNQVDAAVASILEDPQRLPIVEDEVHRQFIHRFPYELYFRVTSNEIRVLAVKHHARNPNYWKSRS